MFDAILAVPAGQIGRHAAFMATTGLIVSRGIGGGILLPLGRHCHRAVRRLGDAAARCRRRTRPRPPLAAVWRVLVRYVAPAAVAMVLMGALMGATS